MTVVVFKILSFLYLIPTLDSSTNRAENDSVVHSLRLMPLIRDFQVQVFKLEGRQTRDILEMSRILRNKGALLHRLGDVLQAPIATKCIDI